MKTTSLIIAIWIIAPIAITSTFFMLSFFYRNLRLSKENESLKEQLQKRNLISISQGVQIEMLTSEKKALNKEIIDQMLADYDHECLIAMNT